MGRARGRPTQAGPLTFRVKVPAGFKMPPHTHPNLEHVTVLAGTFHFGMGEQLDESKVKPMPAGRWLCRKVALLRQKPTTGFRKINGLRPTTFLFSVVCDRALSGVPHVYPLPTRVRPWWGTPDRTLMYYAVHRLFGGCT
jgi:hypothetical protein